jgi:pimeloyl-ACP methyl ester carboxylesterase
MTTTTITLPARTTLPDGTALPDTLRLRVTDQGQGRPVLLLHGGGGPDTVAGFGTLLASRYPVRVLTPSYPGFGGTTRPGTLASVRDLAGVYAALLEQLELTGVTVIGNSVGGWLAAEVALAGPSRVARLVLLDAAGIDSAEHPIADFYSLTPAELAELSWANPEGRILDFTSLPEAQRAVLAGNRAALEAYAGLSMADPGLASRLAAVAVPALALWGEADRIVTPDFGKEYAASIPGAAFQVLPGAGHMPQLETPEATAEAVAAFAGF